MGDRRPTIADVAREAGVSKGLVSFVFNNRPGVAPQTRERIMAAAHSLGWRPRPDARSLSIRRSAALGWVVRREPQTLATDPFFAAFMAGAEGVLAPQGQILVLSLVPDAVSERAAYEAFAADARVDGVFLTDLRIADPRLALLVELDIPAVTIGHPDVVSHAPAVNLADAPGVSASVAHLVGLGHRRICLVGGDVAMLHGVRRGQAFRQAMDDAGLPDAPVIDTDFSAAAAAAATERLLAAADPPTAIVYASDLMAIAGLGVAHQRGLRVPADLSVVGFDGSELARHVFPALTTVVADPVAWGRAAAEVLLRLVRDGKAESVELPPA
ncbi:MAG: LacI family transcriptional regulator, partial [Friedmanniella sp.]|nr:LacI family transcriptional regulator [Friedmanniella sp.]